MFEIGRLTRLALGYESESNSRPIEICVADWLADWPGATIGLLLMRPGEDTYYPAASKVVDGVLHFTPSRADMAIPGDGLAQIVMTDENDVELRSRVVRTMIECSLPGTEAEAPEEPMRPFVDQVLEAAASAMGSADNAKAAADNAEAAADNAEAAAKRAEEAAGMIGPGGGGTGTVTSVNGVQPDEAGNVEIDIPEPPTKLEELEDDAEHRLVTDTEKAAWDAKSSFSGKYADLSGKPTIPTKLSEMAADASHRLVTDTEKSAWNAKSTFSGKYADLTGKPTIPNVPSWALQSTKPTYTAAEVGALPSTYTPPNQTAAQVGADPAGTAASKVSAHNADEDAHPAIRQLIIDLSGRLSALADSDDTTLDQLSEIVAYIKSNKSLIDSITTGKVSTADIVNNLTSTATNKPLSAAQGKALKALIDAIVVPTKLSELAGDATHRVVTDAEKSAWNAKSTFSGKYADLTGKPTKVSAFENDAGYLTEHQDISHLLPRTELGAAVDVALAEAKESGAFDGAKGDKGDKGDSYVLTEADKEEIAEIVPIVKVPETPKIVDSVDDMTDTSKLYVLSTDGMIYAYKTTTVTVPGTEVPTFTNLIKFDASGNPTNVSLNMRFSASAGSAAGYLSSQNGSFAITDDIPYVKGAPLYISAQPAGQAKFATFKTDGSLSGDGVLTVAATGWSSGDNGEYTTTPGVSSGVATGALNLRFSAQMSTVAITGADLADLIVTYNEPIVYTTTEDTTTTTTAWVSTGIAYAPTFETDMIGVLGEGNVVYLSDNLPAGTYTLKHGDDYATVGTITVT